MSNIKTTHRGGFKEEKPGVRHNSGHPESKPGNADSRPDAKMSFREKGLDATQSRHEKRGSSKE